MTQNEHPSADPEPTDTAAWRRRAAFIRRVPISTYRLQLSAAFDLDAAVRALPYLRQLGITDCYPSPYFTAGRGSASGYDVCDHCTIQPELGGEPAFARFAAALAGERLGHVADVVPNHMGLDESRNRWWHDVLARGRRSPCAAYFDIDWQPAKIELRDKILLPILDKPYGDALAAGDVRIVADGDAWAVAYGDRRLPIDVNAQATAISGDPRVLTSEDVHQILERQVYRLAYWRTASDEINYRRFFDVDGLIGIRMELPVVFDAAHARLRALIAQGVVSSVRIDHPDGLADPAAYFQSLQDVATADGGPGIHVVAEKILINGETLPGRWRTHGTTGYDFLCRLNTLFVAREGRAALTRAYGRLCGSQPGWREETYRSRLLVMSTTLASEVQMLASAFNRISERDPRSRDFTLNSLRLALVEFLAALPVYRTYLGSGSPEHDDIEHITDAAFAASRRVRGLERSVFQFVLAVLSEDDAAASLGYPPADDSDRAERQTVTRRLQQFSASVFAKGVEDTAMYRYHPLLSESEVGCGPTTTTTAAADFHAHNRSRAAEMPFGFLATATHDTKLGEDTRARINVISEIPAVWTDHVRHWRHLLRAHRTSTRLGWIPDPHDEYRLYQALAGTWPFRLATGEPAGVELAPVSDDYVRRITEYMLKAAREAKRQTSWINQDPEYEAGLTQFVAGVLTGDSGARFRVRTAELFTRIARAGVVNSLAQVVLKLTSPGIADIYQGCELWDLTLVDPDNRRPVDFAHRDAMLDSLESIIASAAQGPILDDIARMLAEWPTGRIKIYVTTQLLRLRRTHPSLFMEGQYAPLQLQAAPGGSLIAFVRRHDTIGAVVVVPRLVEAMTRERGWPVGEGWRERQIEIPGLENGQILTNVLTGEHLYWRQQLSVMSLLGHCPVGIWTWGVQPAAQQLGDAPRL